ncbi:helix-turn-helix domain-containing protein [Cohnella soli]|uniref:Helix-turn-helix domain-containing protein n=1 Tax=Cohnella soli TaxID=425005 RepID=A0ABW0HP55_9BACL
MRKFQAIIVDDEPLVRLALREYIGLATSAIDIVGEAGDGEEALRLLNERPGVDIVFADIQMPRMNGLELLGALRGTPFSSRGEVVMLSAYGDYDYVREAFVFGAFDYMLKANLDEEYIGPVLGKLIAHLEKLAESAVSEGETGGNDEALCGILQRFAADRSTERDTFTDEEAAYVREKLGDTNQAVAFVRLASAAPLEYTQKTILQTIRSVTDSGTNAGKCQACRYDDRHFALFFAFPGKASALDIRQHLNGVLTDVMIRLKRFLNLSSSVGVSDIADGSKQWGRLFGQAERLAALSYFLGYDRLIYPEAERSFSTVGAETAEEWAAKWTASCETLAKKLKESGEGWQSALRDSFTMLKSRYGAEPTPFKAAIGGLIWDVGSLLYEKGMSWKGAFPATLHPVELASELDTLEQTKRLLERLLRAIRDALTVVPKPAETRLSLPVAKAKALMEKHFHEEVHLSSLSELVGVSESYLSKQFAKEMGTSFISYLTSLRIEQAKLYLQAGSKIYDVAEKVGYENPEHFSRIFKKTTGISPKMYRTDRDFED